VAEAPPESVDAYLAALPEREREVLGRIREVIRAAAPEAEEKISYRIPLYLHHGHLVGFAAFKNHCSLFLTASKVREDLARELERYDLRHTTLRFPVDDPPPDDLVRRIVLWRVVENEERARG
jgi:uncharacterized protein YdhG (YjbR/CyaY superfamily)